ncbi:MAG: hypothetical protein C0606_03195 [Hyphomicrobiales bacterium]|nr:MAG: hypothetical protein C0606_03195 [Hyphomicrobiales bacterium]
MSRSLLLTATGVLASGILFGVGAALSGLTDPDQMVAFFDLGRIPEGTWNPLPLAALVIALILSMAAIRLSYRRHHRDPEGHAAPIRFTNRIDGKMLLGAVLFGAGWGISGLLPEAAIAAFAGSPGNATLFLGAMAVGFVAANAGMAYRKRDTSPPDPSP